MTAARVPALLAGVVAGAFLLAACGVPTSGVVPAGEPATGLPAQVQVYFLIGDRLVAVPRRAPGGSDVATAVRLLFAGPTDAEAQQLGTELPLLNEPPTIAVAGDELHVTLPQGAGHTGLLGQQQLACTVARTSFGDRVVEKPAVPPFSTAAPHVERTFRIRLDGPGWEVDLGPRACPLSGS